MPAPFPMTSNNWPFFIPNQQHQTMSPVVLVPRQIAPASVNSHDVNNLIMTSQQRPQSLMTSDELNRKVDDQIKQHWFLLGERQPPASPPPPRPPSTSFSTLPPSHSHPHPHHHHHHSHSTNSSPDPRKKNVCFNDNSNIRRYSVDDIDISRESTPLKSCLKSSITTTQDEKRPSVDISHTIHTQTIPTSHKTRPDSAGTSNNVYRSPSVPTPIEHWRTRQLKSAPGKTYL